MYIVHIMDVLSMGIFYRYQPFVSKKVLNNIPLYGYKAIYSVFVEHFFQFYYE